MVYICTKFHENIMNGNRVMEQTQKVNRRTDRRMDGRHNIIRPVFDRPIKMRSRAASSLRCIYSLLENAFNS